jgi:hypothetical protein
VTVAELTPMENLKVWLQDLIDSERTIMCSPEWESRIKSMIAASPCAGLWTVDVMPGMGDDQFWVLDHNALEASVRQSMQRAVMTMPQFFQYPEDAPLSARYRHLEGSAYWPQSLPKPDTAFRAWPIA